MLIKLNKHHQINLPSELTVKIKELEDMLEPMLEELEFYRASWVLEYVKDSICGAYTFRRIMGL